MDVLRRSLIRAGLAGGATIVLAACNNNNDGEAAAPKDLFMLAQNEPTLSVLGEALANTPDLVAALRDVGPLTVMAPNNAAFDALFVELGVAKAALFANTALLSSVLSYHVVAGNVSSGALATGRAITTAQGGIFKVDTVAGAGVITDGRNRTAGFASPDLIATNGTMHIIDRVLLPADKNLAETLQGQAQFSILTQALNAAGLTTTFTGAGPFTVFAPTDIAFTALLTELGLTQEALLADTVLLTSVLAYHALPVRDLKAELPIDTAMTTVQGSTMTMNASFLITDQRARTAQITAFDLMTSNGVIHTIDKVLLPPPPVA
jgi:uncharacterized surface protein with fasciclin (FAS1) repeats